MQSKNQHKKESITHNSSSGIFLNVKIIIDEIIQNLPEIFYGLAEFMEFPGMKERLEVIQEDLIKLYMRFTNYNTIIDNFERVFKYSQECIDVSSGYVKSSNKLELDLIIHSFLEEINFVRKNFQNILDELQIGNDLFEFFKSNLLKLTKGLIIEKNHLIKEIEEIDFKIHKICNFANLDLLQSKTELKFNEILHHQNKLYGLNFNLIKEDKKQKDLGYLSYCLKSQKHKLHLIISEVEKQLLTDDLSSYKAYLLKLIRLSKELFPRESKFGSNTISLLDTISCSDLNLHTIWKPITSSLESRLNELTHQSLALLLTGSSHDEQQLNCEIPKIKAILNEYLVEFKAYEGYIARFLDQIEDQLAIVEKNIEIIKRTLQKVPKILFEEYATFRIKFEQIQNKNLEIIHKLIEKKEKLSQQVTEPSSSSSNSNIVSTLYQLLLVFNSVVTCETEILNCKNYLISLIQKTDDELYKIRYTLCELKFDSDIAPNLIPYEDVIKWVEAYMKNDPEYVTISENIRLYISEEDTTIVLISCEDDEILGEMLGIKDKVKQAQWKKKWPEYYAKHDHGNKTEIINTFFDNLKKLYELIFLL